MMRKKTKECGELGITTWTWREGEERENGERRVGDAYIELIYIMPSFSKPLDPAAGKESEVLGKV